MESSEEDQEEEPVPPNMDPSSLALQWAPLALADPPGVVKAVLTVPLLFLFTRARSEIAKKTLTPFYFQMIDCWRETLIHAMAFFKCVCWEFYLTPNVFVSEVLFVRRSQSSHDYSSGETRAHSPPDKLKIPSTKPDEKTDKKIDSSGL